MEWRKILTNDISILILLCHTSTWFLKFWLIEPACVIQGSWSMNVNREWVASGSYPTSSHTGVLHSHHWAIKFSSRTLQISFRQFSCQWSSPTSKVRKRLSLSLFDIWTFSFFFDEAHPVERKKNFKGKKMERTHERYGFSSKQCAIHSSPSWVTMSTTSSMMSPCMNP